MKKMVIIGEREKAKNGLIKSIFDFVFAGILFIFTIMFIVFITTAKNALSSFGLVLGIVSFLVLGLIFLLAGIKSLRITKNNDLIIDKPCLSYLVEENSFLIYNVEINNEEIRINKDDIIKVVGSLYRTFKEVFIIYKKDKATKKISLGYCKNIEEASFEDKISNYLDKGKY